MILKLKLVNIRDIRWPIYAIGSDHIVSEDMNVIYVEHNGALSILDNKNLSGDSIGKRRLRIAKEELYHLKRTLFMFSELVEYTRTKTIENRKFVDSSGIVFNYSKKERKKLIWRKVRSIENYNNYVVLKVAGLLDTFELPTNYWKQFKDESEVYLGLIDFGRYYSIYDIDIVNRKDTWRKI